MSKPKVRIHYSVSPHPDAKKEMEDFLWFSSKLNKWKYSKDFNQEDYPFSSVQKCYTLKAAEKAARRIGVKASIVQYFWKNGEWWIKEYAWEQK